MTSLHLTLRDARFPGRVTAPMVAIVPLMSQASLALP